MRTQALRGYAAFLEVMKLNGIRDIKAREHGEFCSLADVPAPYRPLCLIIAASDRWDTMHTAPFGGMLSSVI